MGNGNGHPFCGQPGFDLSSLGGICRFDVDLVEAVFFPYGLLAMYMQSYAESLVHRMLYAKGICFNLVGFTW